MKPLTHIMVLICLDTIDLGVVLATTLAPTKRYFCAASGGRYAIINSPVYLLNEDVHARLCRLLPIYFQ